MSVPIVDFVDFVDFGGRVHYVHVHSPRDFAYCSP
jgi:hypothetical protein